MTTTTEGVVTTIERRTNTKDGNPRHKVTLADGRVFNTRPNGTINFELTATQRAFEPVTLTTFNGEIIDMQPRQLDNEESP